MKIHNPQAGDIIVFQDPCVTLESCEQESNNQWAYHSRDGVIAFVFKSAEEETMFIINSQFYITKTDMWKLHCKLGNTLEELRLAGGDEQRRLLRFNRYRY